MDLEDIVGKKFNRWTVIRPSGRDKSREMLYECRCDCGTVRNVRRSNLIRGISKSCGCLKSDRLKSMTGKNHHNFKDIAGQRFGRLVAIEDSGERKNGYGAIWKCQCDCGNIAYVGVSILLSGRTKSCGCWQRSGEPYRHIPGVQEKEWFNDLTGEKFGRLLVIGLSDEKDEDGSFRWICKCDCGKEHIVTSHLLTSGRIQSCGCLRNERRLEAQKTSEYSEKERIAMKKQWPKTKENMGMQDNTNVSLMKRTEPNITSSTGVRHVFKKKNGNYFVAITFQKTTHRLYGFKTVEEAKKARDVLYDDVVRPYIDEYDFQKSGGA